MQEGEAGRRLGEPSDRDVDPPLGRREGKKVLDNCLKQCPDQGACQGAPTHIVGLVHLSFPASVSVGWEQSWEVWPQHTCVWRVTSGHQAVVL